MTGLTELTVWGETVKKVKTVRTKNYIPAVWKFWKMVNFFRKSEGYQERCQQNQYNICQPI